MSVLLNVTLEPSVGLMAFTRKLFLVSLNMQCYKPNIHMSHITDVFMAQTAHAMISAPNTLSALKGTPFINVL
jgi:hypothetical protein